MHGLFIGGIVLIIALCFEGKWRPVFLSASILIIEVGEMGKERLGVLGLELLKELGPI